MDKDLSNFDRGRIEVRGLGQNCRSCIVYGARRHRASRLAAFGLRSCRLVWVPMPNLLSTTRRTDNGHMSITIGSWRYCVLSWLKMRFQCLTTSMRYKNMIRYINYKFIKHIEFVCASNVLPTVHRLAPLPLQFFRTSYKIHIYVLPWLLHKGKITCFPACWFVFSSLLLQFISQPLDELTDYMKKLKHGILKGAC